jgi:hypothetical protein
LLRGKQANGEHYYSLWIEDSPHFTAESFNYKAENTNSGFKESSEMQNARGRMQGARLEFPCTLALDP